MKTGLSETVGGCGKHPGQSMINCPMCASERIRKFADKNNITEEEDEKLSYHLVCIKAKEKGVSPRALLNFINHYDKIQSIFANT